MITGNEIIKQAKTYLDTKYHACGRDKSGLDCAGLIIRPLSDLGIDTSFDLKHYSMLPDGASLMRVCLEQCNMKQKKDLQDGDVLLFRYLRNPQHLGYFFKENGQEFFIHAYGVAGINKVIISRLDEKWKLKLVNSFRFKFLEE